MIGGTESKSTAGTASSFVVQADDVGGAYLVWNALGDMVIAKTEEEIGRAMLESLRDPRVPRVEAGPGLSKTVAALSKALESVAGPDDDAAERTAVHLVVCLGKSGGDDVAVWPPKGPPRVALDAGALGARVAELVGDQAQPRVPAGRPPDPGGELWDKGLQAVAKFMPGLFSAEG